MPQHGSSGGAGKAVRLAAPGPTARLPTPRGSPSPRSGRATLAACQALDLPDSPFLPEEVHLFREAASQRTDEFQGIFASRNSSEVEGLRAKLKALDAEESALKESIATLREELDDLTRERLVKEHGSGSPSADEVGLSQTSKIDEGIDEENSEPGSQSARGSGIGGRGESKDIMEERSAQGDNPGDPEGEGDDRRTSLASSTASKFRGMSKFGNGGREALSPILNRRRAEVRFREAELAHEQNIAQMQSGIGDLERRMHKQQQYMQRVDKQVLDAELLKIKYKVRRDKAELRIKSLSRDLSQAYDNIVGLLDERLRAEDAKAKNDALATYLGIIRNADQQNEANFVPNRMEVLNVLDLCQKTNATTDAVDALEAEVANKRQLGENIEANCRQMLELVSSMQSLWNTVPTSLRESVFVRGRPAGGTDIHPVTAMGQISEALNAIIDGLHAHGQKLSKVARSHEDPMPSVMSTMIMLPSAA